MAMIASYSSEKPSNVVWEENFDGNELDMSYWNYELGDGCPNLCGWGNNEREIYAKENIRLNKGNLIITATKEGDRYQSGKITTKDKMEFQYGTIEVRAKIMASNMDAWN